MTRKEYIQVLTDGLYGFDEATRADIILEMEDHIDELSRQQEGLAEEQIIAGLEPPDSLAASLRMEAGIASRPEGAAAPEAASPSTAFVAAAKEEKAQEADAGQGGAETGPEYDESVRGESAHGESAHGESARKKPHSAHITIDGENLDDLIDRLRDMARIFKQQKGSRADSMMDDSGDEESRSGFKARFEYEDEDDEEDDDDNDGDDFSKSFPGESIRRLTLRCRQSDVSVFLSLSGLSIKAEGDNAARMRLSQPDAGCLEIQTYRAKDEPDEIELRIPATVEMVTIVTVAGDIFVADRMGDIALRSTSGDIVLKQCSGNVNVSSISGDVAVARCSEALDVQTTSGTIEVEADAQCDRTIIASVSGDIDFSYPEDFDASLSWSTVSGDIDHDGPVSHGSRSIRLGAGGVPLRLSTVSGDISIKAR
ncbi:MAG: DUF4097 family beta strand repeat-containing protein [Spirochaetaceae bacterium]|nr:DUF4097 family beta strand repeat-containing protein [Spirochaetaceae bacterium]